MIVCKNLCKVYGDRAVLDGLTLTLGESGFYLLLGESGSGKTTFLNILAGFRDFSDGEIVWDGRRYIGQIPPDDVREKVEYITQDSFFAEFLTVAENLRLIKEDDGAIADLLEQFGLTGAAKRLPDTLSGGERQRLAIARAIFSGKRVLLLDEPTASLDGENKRAVFELLASLKDRFLILCASHDEMAKAYADTVIAFEKRAHPAAFAGTSGAVESAKTAGGKGRLREKRAKGRRNRETDGQISESVGNPKKSRKKAAKGAKKPHLGRYLGKYFRSGQHDRRSTVLFTLFLTLSALLCLFADFGERKIEVSAQKLYKINYFKVTTTNKTPWEAVCPDREGIRAVSVSCNGSIPYSAPLGSDSPVVPSVPDYDIMVPVLPYEADVFQLTGKIRYGSYFTDRDQVILSSEMANALMPGHPQDLIGQSVTKNLYAFGPTELTVVGIFDPFDDFDKLYLHNITDISTGENYRPESYENLYFINSRLTDEMAERAEMYDGQQRNTLIWFDDYKSMRAYLDKYEEQLKALDDVAQLEDGLVEIRLNTDFVVSSWVLLPITLFLTGFAALYQIVLKKTELTYGSSFIAVFDYSGYAKKRVINRLIGLHFFRTVRAMLTALISAGLIAILLNVLNRKMIWLTYQPFTFNPLLIGIWCGILLVTSLLAGWILFRRVRVSPWYDVLIAGRDLI